MASDIHLNMAEPGPSGVLIESSNNSTTIDPIKLEYYSDYESDDSVQIIDVPRRVPDVIVLSDSDEDTTSSQKTKTGLGKGKNNRLNGLTKDQEIKNMLESKHLFDEKEHDGQSWKGSKDATCAVCLSDFDDRTFCNSCYHCFCYACILQWSKVVRTCPLCKTPFKVLIHKITPSLTFRLHKFEIEDTKSAAEQFLINSSTANSDLMANGRRFRYRSTRTAGAVSENRTHSIPGYRNSGQLAKRERRRRQERQAAIAEERRREVYSQNLTLIRLEQRGRPRYRETSVNFFRNNPAVKYRIVPWLLRDLNVLLGKSHVSFVMNYIIALIDKIEITSIEFRQQLSQFLFDKADKFADELYNFARSPYDLQAFDDNAVYENPTHGTGNNWQGSVHYRTALIGSSQSILITNDDGGVDSSISLSSDEPSPLADYTNEMFPFGSTRTELIEDGAVATTSGSCNHFESTLQSCSTENSGKAAKERRKHLKHKKKKHKRQKDIERSSSTASSETGNSTPSNYVRDRNSDSEDLRESLDRVNSLLGSSITCKSTNKTCKSKHSSTRHRKKYNSENEISRLHSKKARHRRSHSGDDYNLSSSKLFKRRTKIHNRDTQSNDSDTLLRSNCFTAYEVNTNRNLNDSLQVSSDSDNDTPNVTLRSVVHVVNRNPGPSHDTIYPSSNSSNIIEDVSTSKNVLINEIKDLERRIAENRQRLTSYQ